MLKKKQKQKQQQKRRTSGSSSFLLNKSFSFIFHLKDWKETCRTSDIFFSRGQLINYSKMITYRKFKVIWENLWLFNIVFRKSGFTHMNKNIVVSDNVR